ncbi:MAG: acetate--CoA ligase family protein, partial [Deltaproteobacteria bacterium]|nr:acetate--CoA ligase family protein [Deltaproteobacteria bacterium]
EDVDLAVLLIGNRHIPPTLEQCAQKKVKSALVLSSGFAEVKGAEGRELQEKMRSIAEGAQIRLIGPNCLGGISFLGGLICFAGIVPDPMIPGSFGLVAQSGTFALGLMVAAQTRGLGLSYLISSGNEAVLEAADYIRFLIEDPQTKVIGAFIEGFKDPEKFLRVADLARERGKPIIVLKVGRSQKARSAAQAHTGSLVGSDEVQRAVFREKGIVRVETIDEMVDTAQLFCHRRPLHTGGLGVMTLSGGSCAMISDYCQDLNIHLPELSASAREEISKILPPFGIVDNPLDATGQARMNLEISYRCIDILLAEKNVDILLFAISSLQNFTVANIRKIFEYFAQKGEGAGKITGVLSMITESFIPEVLAYSRGISMPILQGGQRGLLAIRHLLDYHQRLGKKSPAAVGRGGVSHEVLRILGEKGRKTLRESDGHQLLTAYGIQSPEQAIASSPEEAQEAARRLGYPVALKVDSAQIFHKTELGALALNIQDDAQLLSAYRRILDRAKAAHPQAELRFLLQKMAPEGVEVIIGVIMDEQFGPAVMLGMGGVLVEILRDTAVRLAPIDPEGARAMIQELAGYGLLTGYRGKPAADLRALANTISGVSRLALDLKDRLLALDMNPLRVLPDGQGVMALDALVELK